MSKADRFWLMWMWGLTVTNVVFMASMFAKWCSNPNGFSGYDFSWFLVRGTTQTLVFYLMRRKAEPKKC